MAPTTDLGKYNNDWYQKEIGASGLKQSLWFLINALFFINSANPFSGMKCWMLRLFGAKIGKDVMIKPGVSIKYPWKLEVQDQCWIGEKVWIDNLGRVTIGRNVCLSQGVLLLTGNHNYKSSSFDLMVKDIHIEDGVWVGAKSVVCPGVTVATHSVITVGAVLTKDTESYGVYSGNPAVFVRKREIEKR